MNSLQEKIYSVTKSIVEIDDFENYYAEHAISYGLRNYVAKYSLSKNQYLITENALHYLKVNDILLFINGVPCVNHKDVINQINYLFISNIQIKIMKLF